MAEVYQNGAYVVYGKMGVCRVKERVTMAFASMAKEEYYALAPQRDPNTTVYVPCNNETLLAKLRPLLTREEIDKLLGQVSADSIAWIEDKNERADTFRRILGEGDRRQLVQLIRCLYAHKAERVAMGKKLSSADEQLLQDCMRLVEEEFSLSLGIPKTQVGEYIRQFTGEEVE